MRSFDWEPPGDEAVGESSWEFRILLENRSIMTKIWGHGTALLLIPRKEW